VDPRDYSWQNQNQRFSGMEIIFFVGKTPVYVNKEVFQTVEGELISISFSLRNPYQNPK
jgi:hypothetical protein